MNDLSRSENHECPIWMLCLRNKLSKRSLPKFASDLKQIYEVLRE